MLDLRGAEARQLADYQFESHVPITPHAHAHDAYQRVVHEELESPLSAATIADLKRYFAVRKDLFHTRSDAGSEAILEAGLETFHTARFDDLYRRWVQDGDDVFTSVSSASITEALESGAGRIESFVLPHSYRHLSPLVGQARSTAKDVEKGVEDGATWGATSERRPQPRVSTPWLSRGRSVVM